jgi:hypothetical protein
MNTEKKEVNVKEAKKINAEKQKSLSENKIIQK